MEPLAQKDLKAEILLVYRKESAVQFVWPLLAGLPLCKNDRAAIIQYKTLGSATLRE